MGIWRDAVMRKRVEIAQKIYDRLKDCPAVGLSERDQALREAFGWFAMESDTCPECDGEFGATK